jgi:hypothetical protein
MDFTENELPNALLAQLYMKRTLHILNICKKSFLAKTCQGVVRMSIHENIYIVLTTDAFSSNKL